MVISASRDASRRGRQAGACQMHAGRGLAAAFEPPRSCRFSLGQPQLAPAAAMRLHTANPVCAAPRHRRSCLLLLEAGMLHSDYWHHWPVLWGASCCGFCSERPAGSACWAFWATLTPLSQPDLERSDGHSLSACPWLLDRARTVVSSAWWLMPPPGSAFHREMMTPRDPLPVSLLLDLGWGRIMISYVQLSVRVASAP